MNRAFRFSMLAAATLSLIATACSTERDVYANGAPEGMEGIGIAGLTEGARLLGDIGPVTDLDHDAQLSEWGDSYDEGYDSGYAYDQVQLDVYDGNKWAMTMLDIQGGLDHPRLQPGNSLTFSSYGYYDEPGVDTDSDLYVSAIGCSSDDDVDMDSWVDEGGDYFDEPADEVIIDVYEGEEPGTKVLDVHMTFPSTGQAAQAAVVVPR